MIVPASVALVAYTSFSGILVARELDRLMVERGKRAASARPFRAGRFAAKRAAPQLSIDFSLENGAVKRFAVRSDQRSRSFFVSNPCQISRHSYEWLFNETKR